jgi:hypothetical protein
MSWKDRPRKKGSAAIYRLNLFDHPLNASLTPVALYGKENEGYDYDRG